jgi:hypothetical protein
MDREQEFRIVVMGGDDVKPFSVKGCPRVALPLDRGAIVGLVRGPNAGSRLRAECMRTLLQECGYAGSLPIRDAIRPDRYRKPSRPGPKGLSS